MKGDGPIEILRTMNFKLKEEELHLVEKIIVLLGEPYPYGIHQSKIIKILKEDYNLTTYHGKLRKIFFPEMERKDIIQVERREKRGEKNYIKLKDEKAFNLSEYFTEYYKNDRVVTTYPMIREQLQSINRIIQDSQPYGKSIEKKDTQKDSLQEGEMRSMSGIEKHRKIEKDLELMAKVEEDLKIMGINSLGPLHQGKEVIEKLLKRGKTINILIMEFNPDPKSTFSIRAEFEKDKVNRLRDEFYASVAILRDIREKMTSGNLNIRFHEEPSCSMIIADNKKLNYNPYPPISGHRGVTGSHRIGITSEEEDEDFVEYVNIFNNTWEGAKKDVDIFKVPYHISMAPPLTINETEEGNMIISDECFRLLINSELGKELARNILNLER